MSANDCKKFINFPKHNYNFSSVQSDSNPISDFCLKMQTQITSDKCQSKIMGKRQDYVFYSSDNKILNVEDERISGIITDNKLSFESIA